MRIRQFILTILITSSIISYVGANSLDLNPEFDYDNIIQVAQDKDKNVLLFIYRDECPWCKRLKNETLQDRKVIQYINENFVFAAMKKDNWTLPSKFAPSIVPSVFVIDSKTEEMIYWHKGYIDADNMIELLEKINKILASQ